MSVTRVCFVCLGNICRSPTAEGIFKQLVAQHGQSDAFEIESAGTSATHADEPPDPRSTAAAHARGVQLTGRSRQFRADDFERFDIVVAMDLANHDALIRQAPHSAMAEKICLLRDFDPNSPSDAEVPDPYYRGSDGFAEVFEICRIACEGLMHHLLERTHAQ